MRIKLIESNRLTEEQNMILYQPSKDYDFSITDVTVLEPKASGDIQAMDVQSLLCRIDESFTETSKFGKNWGSINIVSSCNNQKNGYSNSLFEYGYGKDNSVVAFSIILQESQKYKGLYEMAVHNTKGKQLFVKRTTEPQKLIETYLQSLNATLFKEAWEIDHGSILTEDEDDFGSDTTDSDIPTDNVDNVTPEENTEESTVYPTGSDYFAPRPKTVDEIKEKVEKHIINKGTYTIVGEEQMSDDEFEAYKQDLRADKDFLKNMDTYPEIDTVYTCLKVYSNSSDEALLIDPAGYSSAKYAAVIQK